MLEIIDTRIVEEGNTDQLKEVAKSAAKCLRVKGDERPTMKEVAIELDGLRKMEKDIRDNVESKLEETGPLIGETSSNYKNGDQTVGTDGLKLFSFDNGR